MDERKCQSSNQMVRGKVNVSSNVASHLKADMVESSTNQITIQDIDIDTMERVLRFIYTGKIDYSDEFVKSLISATCIETLKNNLNSKNCCEALIIGDIYCVSDFKKDVIDFILKNGDAVAESSGFSDVLWQNPAIMKEVFLMLYNKKKFNN